MHQNQTLLAMSSQFKTDSGNPTATAQTYNFLMPESLGPNTFSSGSLLMGPYTSISSPMYDCLLKEKKTTSL